jgi:hypothetical protein
VTEELPRVDVRLLCPLGFVERCSHAVQKCILLLIQLGHGRVQITACFLEILLRLDVFENGTDPELFAAARESQCLFRGADIEAGVPDLLEKRLLLSAIIRSG